MVPTSILQNCLTIRTVQWQLWHNDVDICVHFITERCIDIFGVWKPIFARRKWKTDEKWTTWSRLWDIAIKKITPQIQSHHFDSFILCSSDKLNRLWDTASILCNSKSVFYIKTKIYKVKIESWSIQIKWKYDYPVIFTFFFTLSICSLIISESFFS